MTEVKPEIFNNPALGSANGLPYLDDVSDQRREDLAAKREGRTPKKLPPVERFSDSTTNLTSIRLKSGEIVDPSTKTPGLAYFHQDQLTLGRDLVDIKREEAKKLEEENEPKSTPPVAKLPSK